MEKETNENDKIVINEKEKELKEGELLEDDKNNKEGNEIKENSNEDKEEEELLNNISDNQQNEIIDTNDTQNIGDYLIHIKYTDLFKIPYFRFGNVLNIYFSCKNFNSDIVKLSEMPTPPFVISLVDCKNYL